MADWKLIREQFIHGATPRDLAEEHGVKASTISSKATAKKWTEERNKIREERLASFKERIEDLSDLGLGELQRILLEGKDRDKLTALMIINDINGMKKQQQNITGSGANGEVEVIIKREIVKKQDNSENTK